MPALTEHQACLLRMNGALAPRPDLLLILLAAFGGGEVFRVSPEAAAQALLRADEHLPGVSIEAAYEALRRAERFDPEAEAAKAARAGLTLLFRGEPGYPELLGSVEDAPLALYVRGRLKQEAHPVAFVGSRHPTPYGLRMAARLCADAAAGGYCVVSGLARGIDTQAHREALRAEGLTWAVLGSGPDRIYPAENAGLAEKIVAAGGAVVTEFPFGAPPLDRHFPRRNWTIAGLSWATVVVEGRIKSGSVITAKASARQGRPVLAVPGPADSPLYEASHHLLLCGAAPAARLADIVEQLPPGARRAGPCLIRNEAVGGPMPGASLSPEHRKVLQSIGSDSLTLDELVRSTGLDFFRLSTIIFELELHDLISSLPGQRYAKKGS